MLHLEGVQVLLAWQIKVEGFLKACETFTSPHFELKKRQIIIILHFCWILINVFLQFSDYCEWFLYIALQATLTQGIEEQVKKMLREMPREDSTALYITKIRGSPEAELEKNPSVHSLHHNAEIPRNLKHHHCHFWNQESGRKKIAGGTW